MIKARHRVRSDEIWLRCICMKYSDHYRNQTVNSPASRELNETQVGSQGTPTEVGSRQCQQFDLQKTPMGREFSSDYKCHQQYTGG